MMTLVDRLPPHERPQEEMHDLEIKKMLRDFS